MELYTEVCTYDLHKYQTNECHTIMILTPLLNVFSSQEGNGSPQELLAQTFMG